MNRPVLSIITPVYNVEAWLPACIESVLSQSFQDWELILVNDGSSDRSGEICDEYSARDSRIRVIHKINGGVNTARNTGIQASKGEYITFIDADDTFYTSDTLEKNMRYMYEDINKEIDVVSMPQYLQNEDGLLVTKSLQFKNQILAGKRDLFLNWYTGLIIDGSNWGKILRKRIFDDWKLTEDLIFTEDNYNVPDYCEKVNAVLVSGEGGYQYRSNPTSAIHSGFTLRKRRDQLKTFVKLCDYIKKFDNVGKEEAQLYFNAIEYAYYLYQSEEYKDEALSEISKLRRGLRLHKGKSFQHLLNVFTMFLGYKNGFQASRLMAILINKH